MTQAAEQKPSPHRRKRSWFLFFMKLGVVSLVLVLLAGAGVGVSAYLVYDHVTRQGVAGKPVRVEIPEGTTGNQAGKILKQAGLVDHEMFFRVAIYLDKSKKTIKYGKYDLPLGLSPVELLQLLQRGPNVPLSPEEIPEELKVSIPEGLTIAQMAELFENPEAFLEAASAPDLIERLGVEAPTLEGFLMADTYFFAQKPTPREVVERMVEQFERECAALLAELPRQDSWDLRAVVTVASLVEEEAVADRERPLIAAVIYNRLKRGMPLEFDCTLQYALKKYGQRILDVDKAVDSPYNTYKYPGLPPGPISNPGLASLRAAVMPADVDYLFFVSNADGRTHTFSRTLAEHNRAVARYRTDIAEQRRIRQETNGN